MDIKFIWVDIECPKCGYIEHIQLVDAKTEKTVFCHNCKVSIQLLDNEASVSQGIEGISNAIKGLNNIFKKFGK